MRGVADLRSRGPVHRRHVYGIYPTASVSELEYQLRDGAAVMFVAENQEYVDKILMLADRLPALAWIVVLDESAIFITHPKLRSFGRLWPASEPGRDWLEEQAAAVSPEAPAFIVYTSGTTGHPKGALIAHGKHLAATANIVEHYPTLVRGNTAPSLTCLSAMCSAATSPSPYR